MPNKRNYLNHQGWMTQSPNMPCAVGGTPLIYLREASRHTGCQIYGKAEFMNPGGSVKDRAALSIIEDAEARGVLKPGGVIVEGTAGNTGIGLTLIANARGYRCVIVMPQTQSKEKINFLRMIGADLRLVPAKPYRDPQNYIRVSQRLAQENGWVWANQFDNQANRHGHRTTTAPEIWQQMGGQLDAFTCSCGTGGTLAGTGLGLRDAAQMDGVTPPKIILADPEGSGLYSWVKTGEFKVEGNSITEGIGQSRETGNLYGAHIDDAVRISDPYALEAVYSALAQEGLSVGGSSGINIAAAMEVAKNLGKGSRIVTILADGGARYESKLFNPAFLEERHLPVPSWLKS